MKWRAIRRAAEVRRDLALVGTTAGDPGFDGMSWIGIIVERIIRLEEGQRRIAEVVVQLGEQRPTMIFPRKGGCICGRSLGAVLVCPVHGLAAPKEPTP
jgi:hypothetical protein